VFGRYGQVSCRAACRISKDKMKFAKISEHNLSTVIVKVIHRCPLAVYELDYLNGP
jgi:hypothetical protein